MRFPGILFVAAIILFVLLGIWRWSRRVHLSRTDPMVRGTAASVVAVDLSTSWRARLSTDQSGDSVRARAVAQSPSPTPGSGPRAQVDGWVDVSDLPRSLRAQVLTSRVVMTDLFPNLRIEDPAARAEALRQMQEAYGWYRFELPTPVPVTIRESAQGRTEFDYR